MKSRLLTWVLFSSTAAFAGESMNVAVCNIDQIPGTAIKRAEATASYLFRAIDVEVNWSSCGAELDAAEDARRRTDFVLRVRVGGPIIKAGNASLDLMGRAFLNGSGGGFMADTYYDRIQELVRLYPFVDSDLVLGYTMAHELGHLLIGPGHGASGIMRGPWGRKEFEALSQRLLTFSGAERATILHRLQMRAPGAVEGPKTTTV